MENLLLSELNIWEYAVMCALNCLNSFFRQKSVFVFGYEDFIFYRMLTYIFKNKEKERGRGKKLVQ